MWHVEVPRLGGELELQPPADTTATALKPSAQAQWGGKSRETQAEAQTTGHLTGPPQKCRGPKTGRRTKEASQLGGDWGKVTADTVWDSGWGRKRTFPGPINPNRAESVRRTLFPQA